jgi:hypothetical protein
VGLGEGVAPLDGVGSADAVGSNSADGVVDAEGVPDAEGDAEAVVDGTAREGLGLVDDPMLDGGAPDGVVVQPATTPAHRRAPRAMTVRLTSSG